jgi:hypothetical protein
MKLSLQNSLIRPQNFVNAYILYLWNYHLLIYKTIMFHKWKNYVSPQLNK